ncbi:MAG: 2-amino-4-hydroxy-6-hydroxymethyldihydropteridine diphosphokinase [Chlorobi bacterium]|nr:2-amino-4-hydroxy-6-hydroxymethyldihydropteridine diphosphokinase [Chlorobiota bacterium]
MSVAFLSFGSNKGNRLQNILTAYEDVSSYIGITEIKSDIFETESWGYKDNNYLNSVLKINTNLLPLDLLDIILKIEKNSGRKHKTYFKNGKPVYRSRETDIDILFYEQQIINSERLTVPHKFLHKRLFVLKPLMQIAPDFIHPVFKVSVKELYLNCKDKSKISIYKKCRS